MGAGDRESVKVVVRCRPFSQREKEAGHSCIVNIDQATGAVVISNPATASATGGAAVAEPPKTFTFDQSFDQESKQIDVYNLTARPIVESVLSGYNGTIFAYGQTGTGKTFSMQGILDVPDLRGIIPNSFEHIFAYVGSSMSEKRKFLVRASYLEIYNEEIRDLLAPDANKKLELKERSDTGVYVKDLTSHVVRTVEEMHRLMETGNSHRVVGATLMNAQSSRSHSIFTVCVECAEPDETGEKHIRVGKLNLVDLAGSERQSKTGATGERLKEATKINLSLSALGNVISALVDGKSSHIPYRDSKLTRLLQDSLGGNARTVMIAALSPASYNYDETLSTLRYANRTKNIKNKPKINEDPKDAMLREMEEEIKKLRAQLAGLEGGGEAFDAGGADDDEDEEEEDEEDPETEETTEYETDEEEEEYEEIQPDGSVVIKTRKIVKPGEEGAAVPGAPGAPGKGSGKKTASADATGASAGAAAGQPGAGKPKEEKRKKKKKEKDGNAPKAPKDPKDPKAPKKLKKTKSTGADVEKSNDHLAEMQAQIEREKHALLSTKDMVESEKQRIMQELEQRAAEIERERQERDEIANKLKEMEAQLLVGGVSILDKAEQQEQEAARIAAELEEQKTKERELQRELETQLENQIQVEEVYNSLQEEAVAKTKKIKKLWQMLMTAKGEIKDLQAEHQREREDLHDVIRELTRDLKLQNLVIDSFIPSEYLRLVEQHAEYDEAADRWRVHFVSYTGNNLTKAARTKGMHPAARVDPMAVIGRRGSGSLRRANPTVLIMGSEEANRIVLASAQGKIYLNGDDEPPELIRPLNDPLEVFRSYETEFGKAVAPSAEDDEGMVASTTGSGEMQAASTKKAGKRSRNVSKNADGGGAENEGKEEKPTARGLVKERRRFT